MSFVEVACARCGVVRVLGRKYADNGPSEHCRRCASLLRPAPSRTHRGGAALKPKFDLARRTLRPAAHPTDAAPGTPEKIAVMEQRYADGEQIRHPRDADNGLLASRLASLMAALAAEEAA